MQGSWCWGGYSLGSSSLMEAILKNQLRHVSLAVSFTSSTVNESEEDTLKVQCFFRCLEKGFTTSTSLHPFHTRQRSRVGTHGPDPVVHQPACENREATIKKPVLVLYKTQRNKGFLRTKCVEDVGDENKLAGVELDHGRVGQELGALQRRSQSSGDD